jgi:transcriptional regulator with XRE-family HTH domain
MLLAASRDSDIEVKAIRERLGLTQSEFASKYRFSVARIRDWEQGRSRPDAAMRGYLMSIAAGDFFYGVFFGRTASVTAIAMVFTNVYPRRSIAGQEVIAFVGGVKYRTYTTVNGEYRSQQIRRPDQPSGRRRSTALAAIATGQEHRFSLVIQ